MYDSALPLNNEVLRLIDALPQVTLVLLRAVENSPSTASAQLRDFDNRIKSLFHALEIMRASEAKSGILKLSQEEIQIRQDATRRCVEAMNRAKTLLEIE